jgi:hypothetical protein
MNPVTQIDKNISWQLRAAVYDKWDLDLQGGAGMSFDFDLGEATRIGYFITGRSWQISDKAYNGIGPEILFVTRPTEKIGYSLGLTYFAVNKEQPYLRLKTKLNWNLEHNFDIQASAENQITGQTDFELRLLKNFIF